MTAARGNTSLPTFQTLPKFNHRNPPTGLAHPLNPQILPPNEGILPVIFPHIRCSVPSHLLLLTQTLFPQILHFTPTTLSNRAVRENLCPSPHQYIPFNSPITLLGHKFLHHHRENPPMLIPPPRPTSKDSARGKILGLDLKPTWVNFFCILTYITCASHRSPGDVYPKNPAVLTQLTATCLFFHFSLPTWSGDSKLVHRPNLIEYLTRYPLTALKQLLRGDVVYGHLSSQYTTTVIFTTPIIT